MIRVADLIPPAPRSLGPSTSPRGADAAQAASWFDGGGTIHADTRISADLNPASRGLSVEQHAANVLSHLCADSESGA